MGKQKTLEEIKNILKDRNLYIVDEKEYRNTKSIISLTDNEGYKYSNSIDYMRDINMLDKFSKKNPYTIENIKLWLVLNNYKNKLLSTEYVNNEGKLIFSCSLCGKSYEVAFKHLRNANQIYCKDCSKEISADKTRLDFDFIKAFYEERGLIILDDKYLRNASRLSVITKEGYKTKISYNSLKASEKCEIFSANNPYTIYNINKYIEINNLDCKLISKDYKGIKSKIIFQCSCGEAFKTTFNSFLYQDKYRCDLCSKRQSKYELLVERYLIENKIKYKKEYKFIDCKDKRKLPFDFAIFDNDKLSLLLESDGHHHFQPTSFNGISKEESVKRYEATKIHDEIKNNYCKENKINLLRIPYWEFNNNNYINILNKKLYTQV